MTRTKAQILEFPASTEAEAATLSTNFSISGVANTWNLNQVTYAYLASLPHDYVYRTGSLPYQSAGERTLINEIKKLRDEVTRLSNRVEALAKQLGEEEAERELRDLSLEQAAEEISVFMRDRGETYPSDISDALSLDYDLVVAALHLLKERGVATPLAAN